MESSSDESTVINFEKFVGSFGNDTLESDARESILSNPKP